MPVVAGLFIAAGCLALQIWAYDVSWLTAERPRHCVVWGFGTCETIMASGYASIVPGQSVNFEAVVARLVPLAMWLAVAFAAVRPNKWVVGGATGLALLVSVPAFRRQPSIKLVSESAPVDDRDLGKPCTLPADCYSLRCMAFDARGQLVLRGTAGAMLRCTRPCKPACPAGFRCTSMLVPVTGGNPVGLDACGPTAP